MPTLFVDAYSKTYNAKYFSRSWCVWALFSIMIILIPLFAALATEDFWNRIQIHYEQPIVEYTGQYLLFTTEGSSTDRISTSKFYSSYDELRDNFDPLVLGVSFTITPYSNSQTSKNDRFEATLSFNTATPPPPPTPPTPNEISNIKLILFFNYALKEKAKLLMTSMIYLDIDTLNSRSITTNGELILKQKSPIGSTSVPSRLYYDDLFSEEFSPYDYIELFKYFNKRNFTLSYKHDTNVMKTSVEDSNVNLRMIINVPKLQKVVYISSVYQGLKEAWIQYLAIFIPIFLILQMLFKFILQNKVFPCHVVNDLPKINK